MNLQFLSKTVSSGVKRSNSLLNRDREFRSHSWMSIEISRPWLYLWPRESVLKSIEVLSFKFEETWIAFVLVWLWSQHEHGRNGVPILAVQHHCQIACCELLMAAWDLWILGMQMFHNVVYITVMWVLRPCLQYWNKICQWMILRSLLKGPLINCWKWWLVLQRPPYNRCIEMYRAVLKAEWTDQTGWQDWLLETWKVVESVMILLELLGTWINCTAIKVSALK